MQWCEGILWKFAKGQGLTVFFVVKTTVHGEALVQQVCKKAALHLKTLALTLALALARARVNLRQWVRAGFRGQSVYEVRLNTVTDEKIALCMLVYTDSLWYIYIYVHPN